MGVSIRRLRGKDAPAFRVLHLFALKTAPKAFGEAYEDACALSQTDWRQRIERNHVFGAFSKAVLCGSAQLDRDTDTAIRHKAWLTSLFVDPHYRGKGVAHLLLEHVFRYAEEQGILQIHLSVGDFNRGAYALYERFGFKRYGIEARALWADGAYVDEHLMVRFLDSNE
jgi:GNAT superfamily N-acetyltransferase